MSEEGYLTVETLLEAGLVGLFSGNFRCPRAPCWPGTASSPPASTPRQHCLPDAGADRGVGQNPGDPDTSQRMLQPSIAVLPGEGRDSAPW